MVRPGITLAVRGSPVRPAPGTIRVLIVDDIPEMLEVVALLLKRRGLTVGTANGGKEALDMLAVRQSSLEPFDLVLTDLMMPVSGREVLERANAVSGGFVAAVQRRSDVELWEVTRENRDAMPERIKAWLAQK